MPRQLGVALLFAASFAACSERSTLLDPTGSARSQTPTQSGLPATDGDLVIEDAQLRPGVTADLHLRVYVNEDRRSATCASSDVVFAVPGFAHTAATWAPYAEALFDERSEQACAVIAIDLPGHGGSSLPEGVLFGELFLDDYVTALLAALESLGEAGVAPGTLIGHSQGGLVIQMAQERLLSDGSSLRDAHGVDEVQLLAPVPSVEVAWAFAAFAPQVLGPLLTYDPALGTHASVPASFWPTLFFSNLTGQLASGAPTGAEVVANGYGAPAPLYASLQLVGLPPFARPSVSAGVFSGQRGTRLSVVTFEQDQLIRPGEGAAVLEHLTGGNNGRKLSVITGPEAVHDLYISDPAAILREARPRVP